MTKLKYVSAVVTDKQYVAIAEATKQYAVAFRGFDPEPIVEMLADDVVYESQAVLKPLCGKPLVSTYLRRRYECFAERLGDTIEIKLGLVDLPRSPAHPCLFLQRASECDALLVLKLNQADAICRIDLLLPELLPQRSMCAWTIQ